MKKKKELLLNNRDIFGWKFMNLWMLGECD